ncbi:MAG: hypothetical protein ACI9BD_001047, partial [Candidatus Marinamargulisbacteria bacterium]
MDNPKDKREQLIEAYQDKLKTQREYVKSPSTDSFRLIQQNFATLQVEFKDAILNLEEKFLSHYQHYESVKNNVLNEKQQLETLCGVKATTEELSRFIEEKESEKQQIQESVEAAKRHAEEATRRLNEATENRKAEIERSIEILESKEREIRDLYLAKKGEIERQHAEMCEECDQELAAKRESNEELLRQKESELLGQMKRERELELNLLSEKKLKVLESEFEGKKQAFADKALDLENDIRTKEEHIERRVLEKKAEVEKQL